MKKSFPSIKPIKNESQNPIIPLISTQDKTSKSTPSDELLHSNNIGKIARPSHSTTEESQFIKNVDPQPVDTTNRNAYFHPQQSIQLKENSSSIGRQVKYVAFAHPLLI